jgi:hypothetical protein
VTGLVNATNLWRVTSLSHISGVHLPILMVLRRRKVLGSVDVLDLHVEVETLAGQRVVEVDHSKRVAIAKP